MHVRARRKRRRATLPRCAVLIALGAMVHDERDEIVNKEAWMRGEHPADSDAEREPRHVDLRFLGL
jgi:hypothetical protein